MRWLVRVLGAVSVLVVLVVGIIALMPADQVARLLSDAFYRQTGRRLQIEGGVSPSFWPVLSIRTGALTLENADWSKADTPLLRAEGMTVSINAGALLGGELRITGFEIDHPQLLLETAKDGRANWRMEGGKPPAPSAGSEGAETEGTAPATAGRMPHALEEGLIRGATLRYIDHASGRDLTFDAVDMSLAIPDYAGPFSLSASGLVQGQRLELSLSGEAYASALEGRPVPLALVAQTGGARAEFKGRAGWDPAEMQGQLVADLSDLAALSALTGGKGAPALPQGLGAQSLKVTGQLSLGAKGALVLREAEILADGNSAKGELSLAAGPARPMLTARLGMADLSLPDLLAQTSGGAAPDGGGEAPSGWSRQVIDVSALGIMDASVALVAQSVDLGKLRLGATQLALKLERSRAVFALEQVQAYGGAVTGEFVVNGRGGLSVGGDLTLANLQLQPLLRDLAGWERLATSGNLTLKFLGVGNSIHDIMQGLKGEGQLTLGRGELEGLDIAGMLRNLDASYVGQGRKTVFDGVSGRFTIAEGQLQNPDLQILAPYLTATGAGRIGIGPRDLDYRIRPTAFPGADGTGGVMVPLRITGAWADPTYRLDLESVAREKMEAEALAAEERLKAEAAAAEARAKAELESRLQQELGVAPAPGESLGDAAKRRAREALEAEGTRFLEGLLGGN